MSRSSNSAVVFADMAEEFSAGQEQEEQKVVRKEKKARKRKKGAYRRLVAQMEFYFSDANLRMSKFLAAIYLADPWVPLDTFLTFNKVADDIVLL